MATKTKPVEEERERSLIFEGARKVLLASIGAMALAQEEAQDFIDRLVERGEIAEQEGKDLMREMVEKRRERRREMKAGFNRRVEAAVRQMNVPTKDDIESLSAKITALSKKIDDLKKSQS
jgi:polyhydroxyalkanoate synthesis regulator phasin